MAPLRAFSWGGSMRFSRTSLASLLLLPAVIILLLAVSGCAGESSASAPSPTPVPGGTFVVPLESEPASIEPLNVYESQSILVNHQVFQGLARYETGRRRHREGRARSRRELERQRRRDRVDVQAEEGRHVPAAGEPRGHGAGLRGRLELRHRPCEQLGLDLRAVADQGHRRQWLRREGPERRQGSRSLHLAGHAQVPARRLLPASRPPRRRSLASRLHGEGRSRGLPQQADRHGPVHGRPLDPRRVCRPGEEPGLLGPGARGVCRQDPHAHHGRGYAVAGVPEGSDRLHLGAQGSGGCGARPSQGAGRLVECQERGPSCA